ncbi:ThuA domain-containing protein [Streptomyces sp. NPDC006367]|uniref:ThuA domain-containing protein n=1 Tax=unclassified Streptomyces TaxID=2593676 RepID=UPI0033B111D8
MPASTVLVYTRATGYRHDSLPAAADTLAALARQCGFGAEVTDDPAVFTPDLLGRCATVVFVSTTGPVLTDRARAALEGHVRGGGGFVAVHAAAGAEPDWPFFGLLLGTRFAGHPPLQEGLVLVEDPSHPATAHLPAKWAWTDEWYNFTAHPRGEGVRVLLRAGETACTGGAHGEDHPLSWCHEKAGGRFFFTALGHTSKSYADPAFRSHLLGALRWTADRRRPAPAGSG